MRSDNSQQVWRKQWPPETLAQEDDPRQDSHFQYVVDCAIATAQHCHAKELFDKALDAMLIVDDAGRYIDANLAACKLFGLSRNELVGRFIADFAEPRFDVARAWQIFLKKKTVRGEFRLVRPDGTRRETEFSATAHFLPYHHLFILRDITGKKQAEAEKQALEQTFDNFFQLSLDLLAIATTDGFFRYTNPTWEEVLGFTADELKASRFLEFIHPDDRQATEHQLVQLRNGITVTEFENRYRTKSGGYRWLSWRAVPSQADQLIYATAHDVTAQKEADQILNRRAQQEEALNQVVQVIRSSLDLNTIFSVSARKIAEFLDGEVAIVQYVPERECWIHRVVYEQTNQYFEKQNLEIPDQGNPFAETLKRLEVVRVDDTAMIEDPINQELATSSPGSWLLMPISLNGEIWGSLTLGRSLLHQSPWKDDEINLARRVADQLGIAIQQSNLYQQVQNLNADLETQVQERTVQLRTALGFEALLKRITDKVRDSLDETQILQTAVEELAIGLSIDCCDTALYDTAKQTSTIVYEFVKAGWQNAQGTSFRIQGFSYPEVYAQLLVRHDCQFCTIGQNNVRVIPYRATILAVPIFDDQEILGDLWLFRPADRVFNFQEVRLVQQVANQCAIALRQAHLYHEVQQQVLELERLNHLKDDFLSTVSHELRSPMANITMAAEMLEIYLDRLNLDWCSLEFAEGQPYVLKASIERYFQILKHECHRETDLINNLLDLARLESNREPLNLTRITLAPWLTGIVDTFDERAHNQQQTLQVNIPNNIVLETDPNSLERIVSELLHNACKYTPAQEIICIAADVHQDTVSLSICNSGVEISPLECDRIFEKFYRIPRNDPWKHGGTGLGLALIRKLTQHLHGTIHAQSSDNQLCFVVTLPLAISVES